MKVTEKQRKLAGRELREALNKSELRLPTADNSCPMPEVHKVFFTKTKPCPLCGFYQKPKAMTDDEALEALNNLSPRRNFDINFVLAYVDKGFLHDIHHPEKWYLDITRINGDGKWEYDGKTLGECVEQALKHEEPK